MNRNKIKKLISITLGIATLLGGLYFFKPIKPEASIQRSYKIEHVEVDHSEVIIESIQSINELLFKKTDLSQQSLLKKGIQNKAMKNNKKIIFYATGSFGIDFSKISSKNIIIDDYTRTVKMFISNPTTHIEFDEARTEYKNEQGVLTELVGVTFELEPEILEQEKLNVKQDMSDYMQTKITGLEEDIQNSLNRLILQTTGLDYNFEVVFVG